MRQFRIVLPVAALILNACALPGGIDLGKRVPVNPRVLPSTIVDPVGALHGAGIAPGPAGLGVKLVISPFQWGAASGLSSWSLGRRIRRGDGGDAEVPVEDQVPLRRRSRAPVERDRPRGKDGQAPVAATDEAPPR